MVIKIELKEGVYSSNKVKIKEVFSILDYKYAGANQISDSQLICRWVRKEDKKLIKGIFHGSGKACEFIIDCSENEIKIFNSLATLYGGKISEYIIKSQDELALISKAKSIVDKWWTPQKQYYGEPDLFYRFRKKKEEESYLRFVEYELKKLKGEN